MTLDESIEALADHAAALASPLNREMRGYADRYEYKHYRRLFGLGCHPVKAHAMGVIGIAHVETFANDLWKPCEGGTAMLTVAVHDGEAVTDIVAFDPATPTQWYLRKGAAWLLGADALADAMHSFDPAEKVLRLHATPFEWLRADMAGACVIDWTDEARITIRDLEHVQVRDQRYAQALRLELTRPPRIPQITYDGERRRAA